MTAEKIRENLKILWKVLSNLKIKTNVFMLTNKKQNAHSKREF